MSAPPPQAAEKQTFRRFSFVAEAAPKPSYRIGLVIATEFSIGTLFTLFVVPAVYMLIAADHSKAASGAIQPAMQ